MELLPLVRRLWRRRLLLAAGALVAIAIAFAAGSPPRGSSAVAWTRVALDTPTSQLVDSAPPGADTLPWRASLLTHLMSTDAVQRQLAQRLRVRPDQVAIVDPAMALPLVPASMPKKAADAAAVTSATHVLTVSLKDLSLPTISIEAAAPDRAGAERLAAAAVAVLKAQASPQGRYTSLISTGGLLIPARAAAKLQPFVVQAVAPIRVKTVVKRVVPIKQLGAALFLFGLWMVAVLFLPRVLHRRPRVARAV